MLQVFTTPNLTHLLHVLQQGGDSFSPVFTLCHSIFGQNWLVCLLWNVLLHLMWRVFFVLLLRLMVCRLMQNLSGKGHYFLVYGVYVYLATAGFFNDYHTSFYKLWERLLSWQSDGLKHIDTIITLVYHHFIKTKKLL